MSLFLDLLVQCIVPILISHYQGDARYRRGKNRRRIDS